MSKIVNVNIAIGGTNLETRFDMEIDLDTDLESF